MENLRLEDSTLAAQIKALIIKLETQNERLNPQSILIKNQRQQPDSLEGSMCRCLKNEEQYKALNQNSNIYTNSNLKNSENSSEFSDDSEIEEEVLLKSNEKGKIPKYSSESIPSYIKDRKVLNVEKFDRISTQLRSFLDQLDTYFRIKPATYPTGDYKGRILYISLWYSGAAMNQFTAMKNMKCMSYQH